MNNPPPPRLPLHQQGFCVRLSSQTEVTWGLQNGWNSMEKEAKPDEQWELVKCSFFPMGLTSRFPSSVPFVHNTLLFSWFFQLFQLLCRNVLCAEDDFNFTDNRVPIFYQTYREQSKVITDYSQNSDCEASLIQMIILKVVRQKLEETMREFIVLGLFCIFAIASSSPTRTHNVVKTSSEHESTAGPEDGVNRMFLSWIYEQRGYIAGQLHKKLDIKWQDLAKTLKVPKAQDAECNGCTVSLLHKFPGVATFLFVRLSIMLLCLMHRVRQRILFLDASILRTAFSKRFCLRAFCDVETSAVWTSFSPLQIFVDTVKLFIFLGLEYEDVEAVALEICEDLLAAEGYKGEIICPGVVPNYGPHASVWSFFCVISPRLNILCRVEF